MKSDKLLNYLEKEVAIQEAKENFKKEVIKELNKRFNGIGGQMSSSYTQGGDDAIIDAINRIKSLKI